MEIKLIEIEKIIPYENNPRINDDAVKFVTKSIKDFGWRQPIVVDSNMVIISGHTRLLAGKKLKHSKVPVHVATELTESQVKALRLADNKVSEKSIWDMGALKEELDILGKLDFSMGEFGFESFELGDAFSEKEQTKDLTDSLFSDEEDTDISTYSANLKIVFDTREEHMEALKTFNLPEKTKKINWSDLNFKFN
jgi:site-specific DNA-methyltransferase (adenine-specific)